MATLRRRAERSAWSDRIGSLVAGKKADLVRRRTWASSTMRRSMIRSRTSSTSPAVSASPTCGSRGESRRARPAAHDARRGRACSRARSCGSRSSRSIATWTTRRYPATPIPPSSRSSARSRIAGGIRKATCSGRCTGSIRCASSGSSASQARSRRRRVLDVGLRRRHPRREHGRARRGRARHRPLREVARGREAAQARIRRRRGLPRGVRRGARATSNRARSTSSPAWRCSSTSPTPHRSVSACAQLVKARRPDAVLDAQPQPEVVRARHPRRRVRPAISCRAARTTGRVSCDPPSSPRTRAAPGPIWSS